MHGYEGRSISFIGKRQYIAVKEKESQNYDSFSFFAPSPGLEPGTP